MPETIVIPSLQSLPPAASSASSRPVAASNGAGESTAAASSTGADPGVTEAKAKDSSPFAVVLQRQLAQAATGAKPVEILAAATSTKTSEDAAPPSDGLAALLLSMGTLAKPDAGLKLPEKKPAAAPDDALQLTAAQPLNPMTDTVAVPVITPAAVTVINPVAALVITPAAVPVINPVAALAITPAAVPVITPAAVPVIIPAAALVINPATTQVSQSVTNPATDPSAAPVAAPVAILAAATTTTAAKDVPAEPSSVGLAALLTLPMGAAGRPDTALKNPEKKPLAAAETIVQLASASPASVQARFEADTAAKKSPDAAISAALSALTGDAKAEHTQNSDVAAPKVAFENQLATAQATMQTHGSEAPAVAPLKVETPVGTRGWDGEIGEKVVWMVGHQQQRAELVLNPPALGRVEVTLSMTGDHANASFVSTNPAVREALEAALPRLRETLADAGINLGQANVGSESSNQYTNKQENWDNPTRSSGNFTQADTALRQIGTAAPWLKQSNSLVDVFA